MVWGVWICTHQDGYKFGFKGLDGKDTVLVSTKDDNIVDKRVV